VSLNLKARREERARIDKERLERENIRRAAKNEPPFQSIEELDKSISKDSKDKTKDEAADVLLEQAAQIMADMVIGARPAPQQQKTARAS
jgi:hypothetical protein